MSDYENEWAGLGYEDSPRLRGMHREWPNIDPYTGRTEGELQSIRRAQERSANPKGPSQ